MQLLPALISSHQAFFMETLPALPRKFAALLIWSAAVGLVVGCGDQPTPSDEPTSQADSQAEGKSDDQFVLGNLIEPFDPPTLDELNDKVQWEDSPVVDSLKRLREFQAEQPDIATVEEALELRNDSPENNEKIKRTLGRVRVEPIDGFYGANKDVKWEASFSRHAWMDINSTNPILTNSMTESEVNSLTAFGLFSFDWDMIPFAAADTVESWQTSEDQLYDKVVMRDDLTWSDGEPITAHDVVFSWRVIMTKQVPVPAVRSGTDRLVWIEAYDDHTLVYFHKEAEATNVWNLNFPVIPQHIYEKSIAEDSTLARSPEHVKYEDNPVLGGPYIIKRRLRGREVILERRESWYMHEDKQVRDKPFYKTVRFKVLPDISVALLSLKRGDLDEMSLSPMQWMTQTNGDDFYRRNTKVRSEQWLTWSFQWNLDTPFFDDPRVRWAMGYAFDHDELLNSLRFGLDIPGIGTYHPSSPWCPDPAPEPLKQDLSRALDLLNEAGWVDTDGDRILDKEIEIEVEGERKKTRIPFEFTILCRNQQWRVDVSNLLKENLARIGVKCHVRPLEATVLSSKLLDHKFHAAFGGWGTGADPDTSENIWKTDEGRNFGHYSNPEVDRLFMEGKKESDFEKRREIYAQIHQLLWDDQPYTWLFHESAFYAFSKQTRGYTFSPRGPYSFGPGFGSMYTPAK